jgi:hypothetical protein
MPGLRRFLTALLLSGITASAQRTVEVEISEPATVAVADLFKQADVVVGNQCSVQHPVCFLFRTVLDALVEEVPVCVNHRVGRFVWVPRGSHVAAPSERRKA